LLLPSYPKPRLLLIPPHPRVKSLVHRLGADALFTAPGRGRQLIGEIGEFLNVPLRKPLFGLPWLQSGVHRIYDTVGSSETLEVGVRIATPRATIVIVGVAPPRRFEWPRIYF